jgi:hypothetical protein
MTGRPVTDLATYRARREAEAPAPSLLVDIPDGARCWRCRECGLSSYGDHPECPGISDPCGGFLDPINAAELAEDIAELCEDVAASDDPDIQAVIEAEKPEPPPPQPRPAKVKPDPVKPEPVPF